MGGCAVANCHNSYRKGFRMHKFPADPQRRLKWAISCRRSGWTPGPRAEICHVHFEDSQYEQNRADNLKRLKPNAVPTLFESAKLPDAPTVFTYRGVKGKGSVTMNPVLHSSPLDCTEVHFEELQCEQNRADNLKRLEPNAVPTLFESAKSPDAPAVFTSRGVKGKGSVTMNPVLHSSPLDCTAVSNDELLLRIGQLEEDLIALKLENADLKAENEKLRTDIEANKNDFSFLSKEQLYVAKKKLLKHAWSSEGIIKGLKLRFALGKFGYKFLLSTGYPAPSCSTLNRHIKDFPLIEHSISSS